MGDTNARPHSRINDYDYAYSEHADSRGRPVRNISYNDLNAVKSRELALVRRSESEEQGSNRSNRSHRSNSHRSGAGGMGRYDNNDEGYYTVRKTRREYDDTNPGRPHRIGSHRSRDGNRYRERTGTRGSSREDYGQDGYAGAVAPYNPNNQMMQQQAVAEYDDDDDSDSERERRREEREKRRRKKKLEREAEEAGGHTWFGFKPRDKGNFLEKNFDSSYEGITAAIAGGLIGGMTARKFGGEESRKMKMLAGAAAGAAVVNAAENKYRVYTEDKAEKKEKRWEEKHGTRE